MTHTFDNGYWDQIWQGDRAESMGTSQPNPHLIEEVTDLAPGTALDGLRRRSRRDRDAGGSLSTGADSLDRDRQKMKGLGLAPVRLHSP